MSPALAPNTVMVNHAKCDEVMMNFNYLLNPKHQPLHCRTNRGECYWIPVSSGRSMSGDNIHVPMMCRKCNLRRDIFMTKKEYKLQERIIEKEVENV